MTGLLRNRQVKPAVITVAAVVLYRVVAELIGFGDWVRDTPVASAVLRAFGLLLFGGFGLLALFAPRFWSTTHRWLYRLIGIAFLLIAAFHATLLIGGEAALSNILPE
jgi:hypothetical protein